MIESIQQTISRFRVSGIELERVPESFSLGTFEECKELLREVILAVDKTIEPEELVWLPQYDEIADWMSDTKGKGLFLRGGCGVGKSTILYSAIPAIWHLKTNRIMKPLRAVEINKIDTATILKNWCYCIDDLGTENVKNDFGNRYNVFEEIADEAEQKLKLLLVSTNLTGEEVVRRYGQRILDRIVRLCRIVKFTEKKDVLDENGKTKTKEVDIPSLRK